MNSEGITAPVIEATGIKKAFDSGKDKLRVLDGVDLTIMAGQFASIRGASGSGKSTLLNILAGLDTADAGDVKWSGESIVSQKIKKPQIAAKRAHFCGFVFQAYYLVPELNALENVLLSRRITGRLEPNDRERARWLLKRLGVSNRSRGLANQLSGGERQRIAIARALMNDPKLIIADEPTGNLDEKTSEDVIDLLLGVCEEFNTACLLVTHNSEYASRADVRLSLTMGQLRTLD
ncbi:MAG: ABC transporter ATP-binding protein [Verrucomicrobiota bacterium]